MTKTTRYLGLDVHSQTIAAAIAEGRNEVRSLGQIPNRPEPHARQRAPDGAAVDFLLASERAALASPLDELRYRCKRVVGLFLAQEREHLRSADRQHLADREDFGVATLELLGHTKEAIEASQLVPLDTHQKAHRAHSGFRVVRSPHDVGAAAIPGEVVVGAVVASVWLSAIMTCFP